MERLLRGLLLAVLVFGLLCAACRRQEKTGVRGSASESRPAQLAPPARRVRLAERFERIATTRPCKQSDSRRFGEISMGMAPWRAVREKDKVRVVSTFQPSYAGKLYDAVFINSVRITPDRKHIAYLARDGDRQFVVVDHREEPAFEQIQYDTIQLSNDGARVAYHVRGSEWIADGKKLPESTFLRDLTFSPDGKRLAYDVTGDKGESRLYLDGKVVASYKTKSLSRLTFSPDSKHLLYVLRHGRKCSVVIAGRTGPSFDQIKWNYPGWEQAFFFGPHNKRVVYVGRQEGKDVLVVDETPGEPLEHNQILGIKFSPDGKQVAAMVGRARKKWFVMVNAERTTPRGHVLFRTITFSPDSRYLAYVTRIGNGWSVVINDTPGSVHDRISFSESKTIHFDRPDRFSYLVEKGNETFVVEERLVPHTAGH
jgi:Tol biopolymer transport system component